LREARGVDGEVRRLCGGEAPEECAVPTLAAPCRIRLGVEAVVDDALEGNLEGELGLPPRNGHERDVGVRGVAGRGRICTVVVHGGDGRDRHPRGERERLGLVHVDDIEVAARDLAPRSALQSELGERVRGPDGPLEHAGPRAHARRVSRGEDGGLVAELGELPRELGEHELGSAVPLRWGRHGGGRQDRDAEPLGGASRTPCDITVSEPALVE
jgi:hypothetical protein